MRDYERPVVCEICGLYIGRAFDHSECSKVKKDMYGDTGVNPRPIKKMSKRRAKEYIEYMARHDK